MASEVHSGQQAAGEADGADGRAAAGSASSEADALGSSAGSIADASRGTSRAEAAARNGAPLSARAEADGTDESDREAAAQNGMPHAKAADAAPSDTPQADVAEPADAAAAPSDTPQAEAADAAEAKTHRPRRLSVLLLVAALALVIDLASKLLVVANLSHRAPIDLGVINLTLVRNSGAAFSIGEGQTWVFTVIAAAVVFVILRVSRNLRSLPWACALGMLLGGALGNLGDRIFRSPGLFRGHVVDFIQFHTFPVVHYDFPVFNLADSAIVVGGCLMVLLSFLGVQPDGTRHRG